MVNRYSEVILNIFEQVSRTIERVLESDIISHINIDCMQFYFMPGCSTDDAVSSTLTFYLSILKTLSTSICPDISKLERYEKNQG